VTEVVLFHHVQGLTDGVRAFAEELGKGGHTVHTPDLFDGERPASIDDGIALVQRIGDEELERRANAAVAALPPGLVYGGFSFGGATAQGLAQTTPGARGALLYEACVSLTEDWSFGPWPDGLAVQIHGMDHDPFFADEGDLEAAGELVAIVGPKLAELFTYPGDKHLFTDSSLPSYDPAATALVIRRSVEFLDRLG
jgi:dienelactone hydrolase